MSKAPFACVTTKGRQVWYPTLLEAVELSVTLQEKGVPHHLKHRDVFGEMASLGEHYLAVMEMPHEESTPLGATEVTLESAGVS